MFKLFVILFIVKLYSRNKIFKGIKKSKGKEFSKFQNVRKFKDEKYAKVQADIEFIKCCKSESVKT